MGPRLPLVVLGVLAGLVTSISTIPLSQQAIVLYSQDANASGEKIRGNNWFYLCSDQPVSRFSIERLDIFPNPPRVNQYTTFRLWGGSSASMGLNPSISFQSSLNGIENPNNKIPPLVFPLCETYGLDVWQRKIGRPEAPGGPFGRSCPPSLDFLELTYSFFVWDYYFDGTYTHQFNILDSEGESMVCLEGTIEWRK